VRVPSPFMKCGARGWPIALALGAVTLVLYAWRVQDAPIYVSPDEAIIAVDAYSLATTGRDVHGRVLPLYFQIQMPGEERTGWFTPAIFYLSVPFLKVLQFSERTIRLPTVLVGVTNVFLMYLIGRRLFQRRSSAIAASVLLALTPAHFMLSRYALDYLYPLPFILGWLLCLLIFLETDRIAMLLVATALLGVGFFSYIAAVVMMPLYFVLTCWVLWSRPRRFQLLAVAAVGFGLPLLVLIPWLVSHPTAFADTVNRYNLYDAKKLNALQGLRSFLSYPSLDRMSFLYWSFFNPSFLFFSGDRQMTFSTREVGVFLFPIALLAPLGIIRVLGAARSRPSLLVLFGFITAPAAALLGAEDGVIVRAVELLPFTVLLAVFGVEYLWTAKIVDRPRRFLLPAGAAFIALVMAYAGWTAATQGRLGSSTVGLLLIGAGMLAAAALSGRMPLGRVAALCVLAWAPIQFSYFAADYFGDYRLRSSFWLGGNLRGALEDLIDRQQRDGAPRIYFSTLASTDGRMDTRNRWMDSYWRFYLTKHRRQDLLERTARFDPAQVTAIPSGSLVLANVGNVTTDSLVAAGELKQVRLIPEVQGQEFFAILRR
jgi:4-amino-4-deoxy-L-arabinose transferase-like glycosyltransferase